MVVTVEPNWQERSDEELNKGYRAVVWSPGPKILREATRCPCFSCERRQECADTGTECSTFQRYTGLDKKPHRKR